MTQKIDKSVPFSLGAMYWQNPNFGRPEIEEDMRRIRENNFSIIRAFIWWEQLEKKKGEFNFAMHDILFDAAEKYGIGVMETFGFYLPLWLQRELFQCGIHDRERYYCLDRPEVSGPLRRYISEVVNRYKDAPALKMWNVWNEPTKPPCHCEHTRRKFLNWLKERYGDIDSLKQAWLGERAVFETFCPDSLEELDLPWLDDAFRFGTRGRTTPLLYDWQEFSTVNLTANVQWLVDEVRRYDTSHQTHANPAEPMSNPLLNGVDCLALAQVLDSISVSVHPSHHFGQAETEPSNYPQCFSYSVDGIRSWGHATGKDAWVGELQAGTAFQHVQQYTPVANDISHYLWQALGRGVNGVLFWEWQSWRSSIKEVGEFSLRRSADGGPTERSQAAEAFGNVVNSFKETLREVQRPPSEVAVMVSKDSANFKALQTLIMKGLGDVACEHNHAVYGCYKALNRANIAVDFVTEAQIRAGVLFKYKVLYLPHVEVMGEDVARRIREFVHDGGHVWADGRVAFLDERAFLRSAIPGHGLDELFGCREDDFVAVRDDAGIELVDGSKCRGYRHAQYLENSTGTVAGYFSNGRPAVVANRYGQGVAQLVGSYVSLGLQKFSDAGTMDFVSAFAFRAGVKPKLEINPPTGFEACILVGREYDLIVISNLAGGDAVAEISPPSSYTVATCPMDDCDENLLQGGFIRRVFRDFETVAILCKKPGDG